MNAPQILVINVEWDISQLLAEKLKAEFGVGCRWSSYSRPSQPGHPRMRPYARSGASEFEVIVFDIGQGWGKLDEEDIIDKPILPEWFESDVLNGVKNACLIVLTPEKILMGVKANLAAISKRRPRPVQFVVRDPSQWGQHAFADPAMEIRRCLADHNGPKKPPLVDTIGLMFSAQRRKGGSQV